jgi:hypothetical protein
VLQNFILKTVSDWFNDKKLTNGSFRVSMTEIFTKLTILVQCVWWCVHIFIHRAYFEIISWNRSTPNYWHLIFKHLFFYFLNQFKPDRKWLFPFQFSLSHVRRYTPEIFLFSTATFKYTYRVPLRRIISERNPNNPVVKLHDHLISNVK